MPGRRTRPPWARPPGPGSPPPRSRRARAAAAHRTPAGLGDRDQRHLRGSRPAATQAAAIRSRTAASRPLSSPFRLATSNCSSLVTAPHRARLTQAMEPGGCPARAAGAHKSRRRGAGRPAPARAPPSRSFQEVGHVQLVILFEHDAAAACGGGVEHPGRRGGVRARPGRFLGRPWRWATVGIRGPRRRSRRSSPRPAARAHRWRRPGGSAAAAANARPAVTAP